jgi:erythronate-4-phosphate dehydrogenase
MKIIADQQIPLVEALLSPYADIILKPGRAINAAEVKDADILIVRSITKVDKALLATSKVKFVASVTAGADHLDIPWLDAHGIAWTVVAGFNAPPVADYVVSVLAVLEQLKLVTLHRCKIAVVGVGNVGRLVVKHLQNLRADIVVCDPLRAQLEPDFNSTAISALTDCDVISLHVPLTTDGDFPTYHFIDQAFLQRLKPGAVLINTSRGAVIDSKQLLDGRNDLRLCFDVWENEPTINQAVLNKATIATPHIAGYSMQSKRRGMLMLYQLLCQRRLIEPLDYTENQTTGAPYQLQCQGQALTWHDVVLTVFNPLSLTHIMQQRLANTDNPTVPFDQLRELATSRQEFSNIELTKIPLADQDRQIIQALGFKIG